MASTWDDEAFAAPGAARVSCESLGVSCFDAILPPAMSLPLSGVTVLSLEQAISAPLGSRHLADWGARVIKIERPGTQPFFARRDPGAERRLSRLPTETFVRTGRARAGPTWSPPANAIRRRSMRWQHICERLYEDSR
jgi:hypothetical protein